MKKRLNWLINIIWLMHLLIIIIWFGLFLIPLSVFPQRIAFHFWYMAILIASQFLWGGILYSKTKDFQMICPITTPMQSLRGYKIQDKRNYKHSYIAEFLSKFRINISFKTVNYLLWITFAIVIIQYFN
jgi:hypothetical protein